jgi:transposase
MAFAQLTFRESLRDIEVCLRSIRSKLYHMGIRSTIARNTLANANRNRDWRIYADVAQILINIARGLYRNEEFGIELKETVYALDSTTIDLCLSLFPWAQFRKYKGAVKMHTLLDLRGNIHSMIWITDGKVHDLNILDELIPEPGAFYIMDRAYIDFLRLYNLHLRSAFFVTRAKKNLQYRRIYSQPIDKSTGLRCDQIIRLTGPKSSQYYPEKIRRISFFDIDTSIRYIFLTNNFSLPALIITILYKNRWQIELFFKWIKQHLKIKKFYGYSMNAVKTQLWIAISVYVLVAILKKRLKLEASLYTILQILSLNLFEKVPLLQVLTEFDYRDINPHCDNQLTLFDL